MSTASGHTSWTHLFLARSKLDTRGSRYLRETSIHIMSNYNIMSRLSLPALAPTAALLLLFSPTLSSHDKYSLKTHSIMVAPLSMENGRINDNNITWTTETIGILSVDMTLAYKWYYDDIQSAEFDHIELLTNPCVAKPYHNLPYPSTLSTSSGIWLTCKISVAAGIAPIYFVSVLYMIFFQQHTLDLF